MTNLQLMVYAIIGVTTMTKAQWVITIRDNGSDVPAIIRLRRLLKILLRTLGFKCLDIRELNPVTDATEQEAMIDKTTVADHRKSEVY